MRVLGPNGIRIALTVIILLGRQGTLRRSLARSARPDAATSRIAATMSETGFAFPTISGRQLLLDDGNAFVLRSFAYRPTPICGTRCPDPDGAYFDSSLPHRDGPWLRAAGANAVRIYGALFTDGSGNGIIQTTSEYLQQLANEGLWVLMGTEITIDPQIVVSNPNAPFSDFTVRQNIKNAHLALVEEFGSDPRIPNILMWVVGNEINAAIKPCNCENLRGVV